MAENSKIEWTAHTWNPVSGCRKVSQGCKFCYAERFIEGRQGKKFTEIKKGSANTWRFPYRESAKLAKDAPLQDRLVFTCSMSDWFIEEADEYRADMWRIVRENPELIFQILTKRTDRILSCLPEDWGQGYPNVWIGASVENQEAFDLRVPILSKVPAAIRFLSAEPLIGPISISLNTTALQILDRIDWVIIGGESGNDTGKWRYRPCELGWMEDVAQFFTGYRKAVFVKQMGTHLANQHKMTDRKGGKVEEFPGWVGLRQRKFPTRAFSNWLRKYDTNGKHLQNLRTPGVCEVVNLGNHEH